MLKKIIRGILGKEDVYLRWEIELGFLDVLFGFALLLAVICLFILL